MVARVAYSQNVGKRPTKKAEGRGELDLLRAIRSRAARGAGVRDIRLGIGDDCALLRQCPGECFLVLRNRICPFDSRETEIEQLHTGFGDEDVCRLEITMNNSALMSCPHGLGEGDYQRGREARAHQ